MTPILSKSFFLSEAGAQLCAALSSDQDRRKRSGGSGPLAAGLGSAARFRASD